LTGDEDLDVMGRWNQIPAPKNGALFPGEHFDYLTPWAGCNGLPRGSCTLIEPVAAELSALFIMRHMPAVDLSQVQIPVTLDPPNVTLTPKQQFFGAAGLTGLTDIKTRAGCSVKLRWVDGSQSGSRQLGP
jgi:hypothetical protein